MPEQISVKSNRAAITSLPTSVKIGRAWHRGLPIIRNRAWPSAMTNPLNSTVKLAIYENKLNTAAEGDVRRIGSRQKQKLL